MAARSVADSARRVTARNYPARTPSGASPDGLRCLLAMIGDRIDTSLRRALAVAFVVAGVPIAFVVYALLA